MGIRLILSCVSALLAVALLQTATQPAHALTIRDLATTGETHYIALEGNFEAGDDRRFVDKILGIERAVIVLESPGGMIDPALAIGKAIRLKGFDTVVRDGTACASACGLVWLAGVSRYTGESARLGFHAVFVMEDGQAREKGAANAVVGAYLAMLGLPTRAIRYVTTAAPSTLSWLSFEEAKKLGIALERTSTGFPPDASRTAKADPKTDGVQSPPDLIRTKDPSKLFLDPHAPVTIPSTSVRTVPIRPVQSPPDLIRTKAQQPAPAKIPNTSLRNTHSGWLDCKSIAAMLGLPADAPCEQTHETVGGENPVRSASRPQFVAPRNANRASTVRNKTVSVSARPGGKGKCSSLQARCATEAGGTCNPATGYWRYMGYEHAHMRYNDCLSRGLARR